jgi:hypothetical protein
MFDKSDNNVSFETSVHVSSFEFWQNELRSPLDDKPYKFCHSENLITVNRQIIV